MASDWEVSTLGELAEIVMGQSPKGADCNSDGHGTPLLNGPTEFGSYHPYPTQFTTDPKRLSKKDDLLFCVRGSTTGRMNWADKEYAIGRGLAAFRHKKGKDFQSFLKGIIDIKLPELLASATGSTFPNVSKNQLNDLEITLPPLPEQKAIAHILGSLDDKIELNRQMNETLEAMAQALFKSWFVDFDPVIDNALAAGHAIPDEFSERAKQRQAVEKTDNSDIHKLFPDEFEFTEEMGWIPKGWIVDDISSLCEKIQSGGTPRRNVPEYWEDGTIPWLTSGEVRQTIIIKVENKISESGLTNSSAKWLASGATVVAMYGATAGQVAYIDKPLTTNQAVCGLIPKKGYQFFNYVTLSRAVAHFEGRATGSAQQNINKGMIESTRVVVPSSISSDYFEEYCEVIFSKWIKNLHENETLAKLRDTLLPKLMSGELRIADATAMVEEVSHKSTMQKVHSG